MKIELLFGIDKHSDKVNSKESFFKCLVATMNKERHADFSIEDNYIVFQNSKFTYRIQENYTSNNYLILDFVVECNRNLDSKKFVNLTKEMQPIIDGLYSKCDNSKWICNDVNFNYAKKAYPIIFDLENTIRRILSKFSFIKYGSEMYDRLKEFNAKVPKKVNFNKGEGSFFYRFVFSYYMNFLFGEENKDNSDLYWSRVIRPIIGDDFDEEKLKTNWKILRGYRNTISHSPLFFSLEHYNDTIERVELVKEQLNILSQRLDTNVFLNNCEMSLSSYRKSRETAINKLQEISDILKSESEDYESLQNLQQEVDLFIEHKDEYEDELFYKKCEELYSLISEVLR